MTRERSLVLPGLLVLLALLAWAGRPDAILEQQRTPVSREARANDWLALGRLLAQQGMDVQFLAELPPDALPPPGATLWLPVSGTMLGERRTRALLDWVTAGGQLVIPASDHRLGQDDPLRIAAGIEARRIDVEERDRVFGEQAPWSRTWEEGLPYEIEPGEAVRIDLAVTDQVSATGANAQPLLCDPAGCHAVRVSYGDGAILALADTDPFRNGNLARLDHAVLASHLLASAGHRVVWIVYEERVPSLFALLWQHAGVALVAALLATGLWIWSGSTRFGPPLPAPQVARRRLAEHVQAAGLLLAGRGGRQRLWQAARADFLRTLHRRHPQSRDAGDEAIAALVARHAQVDAAAVQAALTAPSAGNTQEFAAAIRRLEILRRML